MKSDQCNKTTSDCVPTPGVGLNHRCECKLGYTQVDDITCVAITTTTPTTTTTTTTTTTATTPTTTSTTPTTTTTTPTTSTTTSPTTSTTTAPTVAATTTAPDDSLSSGIISQHNNYKNFI